VNYQQQGDPLAVSLTHLFLSALSRADPLDGSGPIRFPGTSTAWCLMRSSVASVSSSALPVRRRYGNMHSGDCPCTPERLSTPLVPVYVMDHYRAAGLGGPRIGVPQSVPLERRKDVALVCRSGVHCVCRYFTLETVAEPRRKRPGLSACTKWTKCVHCVVVKCERTHDAQQ